MKLYAILLLALVYSAKCAPSEYSSEVESQTVDEAFDDELAFELANNFENEEDLNALLTLVEVQNDEEARGKFSGFAKVLRSIAKFFKGVGKVRKQFKEASDLDKNQRIENEEDLDEEARGKLSGFSKMLRAIAKFFKGVGKARKQFKEASDLDKNQRIENEEDLNAFLTLIEQESDEEARGKFSGFAKVLRSIAKFFKGVGKVRKSFKNASDLDKNQRIENEDEEARGKFSGFAKVLRSIAKFFKGVGKVRKQFKEASDLDKNQRIENEEDLNAFLTLIEQQPDEEARGKFSGFAKVLRSIAKFFKGVGKVRKSFKNASDLDKNQ